MTRTKREILEEVKRILSHKELTRQEVQALEVLASEYRTLNSGGRGMKKTTESGNKKSGFGGPSNWEKYGEVVDKNLKIKQLHDEAEEGARYTYFMMDNKTGEVRKMQNSNGTGVAAFVYRVPPKNKEEAEEKKPAKKADKKKAKKSKHTAEEIMDMTKKELKALIEEEDIDVDPADYKKFSDLQEAVMDELGVEREEEEEEVEVTYEQIMEMDRDTLESIVEENDLEVDVDKIKKIGALRKAVAEALGAEPEDEDEE